MPILCTVTVISNVDHWSPLDVVVFPVNLLQPHDGFKEMLEPCKEAHRGLFAPSETMSQKPCGKENYAQGRKHGEDNQNNIQG